MKEFVVADYDYDLAVVGGGPGGYTAAICGARKGLRTVLIEKDALGGTCLNRGCIPTKSYIYDTKLFKSALSTQVIRGTEKLTLDGAAILNRKRNVVRTLVSGVAGLVKSNGIDLIQGQGVLQSADRVVVSKTDGSVAELRAKNIVLATGSKPAVPSFIKVDGKRVQTTDDLLDAPSFAGKILIIGGGVIGIEMATIFLNAGAKVTIIEMLPDILATEDKDVRKEMKRQLKKRKAKVLLNSSVKDIAIQGTQVDVTFMGAGKEHPETMTVDKVLVATGRAPVFSGIDTEKVGLETNGPFIKVNAKLETSLPGVYAIGDVIGGMMLAHKASAEAETVVENILGADKTIDSHLIPRCIWGLLEIGAVGLSENEASKSGRKINIGKFPYSASGAAQAMGHVEGFVKIIGDVETGEILGVHIIGEHATDMIAEAVTVMKMEGAVEDLYEAIKPHPTLSEAVMEAALDWNGIAVHLPRKPKR
ncbi:MAG: dihydrolipoyl dehydrogenase [Desulfobacteraceae bacterium]|nr:dihydrolipoyl dehydrogenase [Desulfobacteraceae bacterium]MBC2750799.1 dihydrolipoyl dehydrogenase [Desulfobacteraceae bacterium]